MAEENKDEFAFTKINYMILAAGLVLILVGFLLMMGGGTESPNEFSYEIFSTRRITVAPIVSMLGYAVVFYAIMKKGD